LARELEAANEVLNCSMSRTSSIVDAFVLNMSRGMVHPHNPERTPLI